MSNQQTHEQLNRYLSFLAQDEANLTLLVQISDLYIELEDLDKAQEYLDKASAINRIACLGYQGLLHLNQGNLMQAQEHFIEALSHEDTPSLRYNLGFTYFINADLDNAEKILLPVMAEQHHPEAQLLMARIIYGKGQLEQAITLVKEILAHNAKDAEALGLLALLHFDLDENELAAQIAKQALVLNPDNYDAKLIDAMSRLATQEASSEELEELLQINPDDCRLWFALGSVHMGEGAIDLAEEFYKKAIEIYPEYYDCYIALGWCLLLQDDLDNALTMYQTSEKIAPELADSWGGMALVSALSEDFVPAEQLIQKARGLADECFLADIAECIYLNHQNPVQAKAHLVQALRNTQVPISEKLAFIIEELQGPMQVH